MPAWGQQSKAQSGELVHNNQASLVTLYLRLDQLLQHSASSVSSNTIYAELARLYWR